MIKNIIFDFDDTLVDFTHARNKIAKFLDYYCYRKYGVRNFGKVFDVLDAEMTVIARTKKDPKIDNRALWAKMAGRRLGIELNNKQCQEIRKLYWKIAEKNTPLIPHAKEILTRLSKKYTLFVLSDADGENPTEKLNRVKDAGLAKLFKGFVFGDALKTTKPDMRFYTYIIKKYKVSPKECMMVGDKPQYDLIFAKKLGMKTIWFNHGRWAVMQKGKKFNYVDYKISDLRQLLNIFK